ncbi:hypothetical protein D9M71_434990 [compost metagenome]
MDARLDLGLAQVQMQLERFVHGPAMFEAVVTAGSHDGRKVGGFAEGRNDRRDVPDLGGAGTDDPGAPGAEHPFVSAGDEEVAVHVGKGEVFDAKTVHPVDHVQDVVLLVALTVLLFDQLADFADRQFHAAARLHPGHAQYASLRADAFGNRIQHFIHGNVAAVVEQLELAHLGALALLTKFQGVVGGVMLVFADQDFLVRAHMNAAIDHRQAFGGAAGQRDLLGFGIEVASGPDPHVVLAFLGFLQVPVHGPARVAVDVGAVHVDRVAHRRGVRGDEEIGEMQVVRVLIEQLAQLRPFALGQGLRLLL